MTSIMDREFYSDIVKIDTLLNMNFTIDQEPLAIVLEMVLGIKDKAYWERSYKAIWKIENSKLYLKNIISHNVDISMNNFFSTHIDEFGEYKPIFANWYSGSIIVEVDFLSHILQNDTYVCITCQEFTISNGDVISQNVIYYGEIDHNLPF